MIPEICFFEPVPGSRVQRRVVCAANKVGTVIHPVRQEVNFLILGSRHYSPQMSIMINEINRLRELVGEEKIKPVSGDNQGFIDQFDNYLTRDEAMIIAKHANQILPEELVHIHPRELFSENLY